MRPTTDARPEGLGGGNVRWRGSAPAQDSARQRGPLNECARTALPYPRYTSARKRAGNGAATRGWLSRVLGGPTGDERAFGRLGGRNLASSRRTRHSRGGKPRRAACPARMIAFLFARRCKRRDAARAGGAPRDESRHLRGREPRRGRCARPKRRMRRSRCATGVTRRGRVGGCGNHAVAEDALQWIGTRERAARTSVAVTGAARPCGS